MRTTYSQNTIDALIFSNIDRMSSAHVVVSTCHPFSQLNLEGDGCIQIYLKDAKYDDYDTNARVCFVCSSHPIHDCLGHLRGLAC